MLYSQNKNKNILVELENYQCLHQHKATELQIQNPLSLLILNSQIQKTIEMLWTQVLSRLFI